MTSKPRALPALLVAGLLAASAARAEPSNSDAARAKETARAHFERGVTLAREGRLEGAVAEFEGAYRIRPHHSVLFNLAQAQAAMGHSVEAADAFRRYLDEGGNAVSDARRAHVKELIRFHEKRLGSLRLLVEPNGAEVWLDGRLLGTSPLSTPLKLVEGSHGIAVKKSGFVPLATSVEIEAGSSAELTLRAESLATTEVQGLLIVRCEVPDVEVSIGEDKAGTMSSISSFRANVGQTSIRLARAGYIADARTIDLSPSRPAEIDCRLEPDAKAPRGALRVSKKPADAVVRVDGKRYRGEPVPVGRHIVRVERNGYHPFTTLVRIEPGNTAQLAADLRPTKAQQDAWQAERSNRTAWAIAATIGGVVLAGTATATYVWNSHRYDDWLADRRELDSKLLRGPVTPALLGENAALTRRSVGIERADAAAVGLGIAGALTLGTSGALWLGVADGS